MQHRVGDGFDRVTLWRRRKRYEAGVGVDPRGPRKQKPGRREWSDGAAESIIQFVASGITLHNRRGFVEYGELMGGAQDKSGVMRGLGYAPADEQVLAQVRTLARRFNPFQIATAFCELVPLNFVTRGGRGGAGKLDAELAARVGGKADPPLLSRGGDLEGQIDHGARTPSDIDSEEDELVEWLRSQGVGNAAIRHQVEVLRRHGVGEELTRSLLELLPEWGTSTMAGSSRLGRKTQGTPVQRVGIRGVTISARMACHWRRHQLFKPCLAELRKLLTKPEPRAPYAKVSAGVDRVRNARFNRLAMRLAKARPGLRKRWFEGARRWLATR